jgi:Leucine-rich repeat (LRR) protein
MKKTLYVLIIPLLPLTVFGQSDGHYSDFATAFANMESVKTISIDCMHLNELRTDGCESLPYNIGTLSNLTGLYISESNIKSLPASINQLSRLKELGLNYLYSFNYESELCKLTGLDSLQYLGLWMARIKVLPPCIGQIKSLKQIDVSQNEDLDITSAFKVFRLLSNLEKLNLSGINNLKVIPKEISEIRNLQSIQLNYLKNKFDYKTSFERMSSLKISSLSLTDNWLNTLPQSITLLKNITYIDLSDNYFKTLPLEIFDLTSLKHIKIQSNNRSFKTIGSGVSRLINLEKINLGLNSLLDGKEAIISLSSLPKLKDLDFFGCQLDTIPDQIINFIALEKLNLTRNPKINFSDLFIKLSKIKTLKYLDLSDNKLTILPKEIGQLFSLEYLVFGQNAISALPEEFFNLTNLKVINLYGTYNSKISDTDLQKIKDRLPNCKIIDEWVYRD